LVEPDEVLVAELEFSSDFDWLSLVDWLLSFELLLLSSSLLPSSPLFPSFAPSSLLLLFGSSGSLDPDDPPLSLVGAHFWTNGIGTQGKWKSGILGNENCVKATLGIPQNNINAPGSRFWSSSLSQVPLQTHPHLIAGSSVGFPSGPVVEYQKLDDHCEFVKIVVDSPDGVLVTVAVIFVIS
jgi:hypothetical protein